MVLAFRLLLRCCGLLIGPSQEQICTENDHEFGKRGFQHILLSGG